MINTKKISDNLNLIVKNLNEKAKEKADCTFFGGGDYDIVKIIKSDFPLSQGVAFLSEGDFARFNGVNEKVKEDGGTIYGVVLNKGFDLTVENVCGVFNVSDGVRYVVIFDRNLLDAGLYYATVRNIPVIYAFPLSDKGGLFKKTVEIKNGGIKGAFAVNGKKYVVLYEEENIASGYINVIKHLITLLDYRFCYGIGVFSSGDETAYNLLRDCVKQTYNAVNSEDKAEKILYYYLASELADAYAFGKLFSCSSVISAEKILKDEDYSINAVLELFTKLYKIYALYCKEEITFPIIIDYNERAEKLSKITRYHETGLAENYKSQLQLLDRSKKRIAEVVATLKKEIILTCALIPEIEKTFYSLGGKKQKGKNVNYAVKYAGDTDKVNFLSVIRETGLLEGIKG